MQSVDNKYLGQNPQEPKQHGYSILPACWRCSSGCGA